MSYTAWLNNLRQAEKISVINGKLRKIHYKFPDGQQMVEDYNVDTHVVQRRAWRKEKQLMGGPEWEIELGENAPNANRTDSVEMDDFVVMESNETPTLSKRITRQNIEWRIRNLKFPEKTYQVIANPEKRAIIVRTTNKKYYKEITVPELDRCGLQPVQDNISTHYQYNTLIITYKKPELVSQMEADILLLLKEMPENDMDNLINELLNK